MDTGFKHHHQHHRVALLYTHLQQRKLKLDKARYVTLKSQAYWVLGISTLACPLLKLLISDTVYFIVFLDRTLNHCYVSILPNIDLRWALHSINETIKFPPHCTEETVLCLNTAFYHCSGQNPLWLPLYLGDINWLFNMTVNVPSRPSLVLPSRAGTSNAGPAFTPSCQDPGGVTEIQESRFQS